MLTVSKLAKSAGLSRATLLYYERAGLLKPAARAANGYRYYTEREVERLKRIIGYRSFGVPVDEIRDLLDRESGAAVETVLRRRFDELETQIGALRDQQRALLSMLEHADLDVRTMTKERWTAIMRAAGLSDEDMQNWHREFEAREPAGHQEFLESLDLDSAEIRRIRAWSRR